MDRPKRLAYNEFRLKFFHPSHDLFMSFLRIEIICTHHDTDIPLPALSPIAEK